uniref:hypothetical protein n=1 Tax=Cellvibrio fontiphilus TaxID=1815559 RepID=UPI002B4BB0E3|nr:hypothetical protein [Cellvibrio fontiphilus]
MDEILLNHIQEWESAEFLNGVHFDGGNSLAIGYGFDLLVRDIQSINTIFNI